MSSSSSSLMDRLTSDPRVLISDGGTGEELFARGVEDDRQTWSAKALVEAKYHPILIDVHRSFVKAGSEAVTTNSYAVVPGVGFAPAQMAEYAGTAGRLARGAVGQDAWVLGSLGPLLESYRADKLLAHDEGVIAYGVLVEALEPWVDAFLAETMSCVEEAQQAVDAIAGKGSNKPCLVSFTLDEQGRLRDGAVPSKALPGLIDFAEARQVNLCGVLFNCALPEAITLALQDIKNDTSLTKRLAQSNIRLGAYANRLTPVAPDWTMAESDGAQPFRQDLDPQHYQNFVNEWVNDLNVGFVGGCCGMTPKHIALIAATLRAKQT